MPAFGERQMLESTVFSLVLNCYTEKEEEKPTIAFCYQDGVRGRDRELHS